MRVNRVFLNMDLAGAILDYERIIKACEKRLRNGNRLNSAFCEFHAAEGAFGVRRCVGVLTGGNIQDARNSEITESEFGVPKTLPGYETVQNAARELVAAVEADDNHQLYIALERMGVLALCPVPEQQFRKLETISRRLIGRAQLILLVELSLLAAGLGDYVRADRYVQNARVFDPHSWELYNLCVVEGLIALNAGKLDEAIRCLVASINACQANEYASLACSVRAPNLVLAEKLLERGERYRIQEHLTGCKNVWQFLGPHIEKWVSLIERGEKPDFQASRILRAMEHPAVRLQMQLGRAGSIEEEFHSDTQMSPGEVIAGRERLRAGYKRHGIAAFKGELGGSKN